LFLLLKYLHPEGWVRAPRAQHQYADEQLEKIEKIAGTRFFLFFIIVYQGE